MWQKTEKVELCSNKFSFLVSLVDIFVAACPSSPPPTKSLRVANQFHFGAREQFCESESLSSNNQVSVPWIPYIIYTLACIWLSNPEFGVRRLFVSRRKSFGSLTQRWSIRCSHAFGVPINIESGKTNRFAKVSRLFIEFSTTLRSVFGCVQKQLISFDLIFLVSHKYHIELWTQLSIRFNQSIQFKLFDFVFCKEKSF
jgi:hypothetical protein